MPKRRLGQTLRERRKAARVTQGQLASAVGVHRTTIVDWEAGNLPDAVVQLGLLGQILGFSLEDAMGIQCVSFS